MDNICKNCTDIRSCTIPKIPKKAKLLLSAQKVLNTFLPVLIAFALLTGLFALTAYAFHR